MKELKVGVLLGGSSSEHLVSLQSGVYIARTLDKSKYSVKLVPVTKNGDWIITTNTESVVPDVDLTADDPSRDFMTRFIQENDVVSYYGIDFAKVDCDVFFIGLHGGEGEDGTLQGFLKTNKKPYTGSGVLASALAMDKDKSGIIFKHSGMNVPEYITLHKNDYKPGGKLPFGFPVIAKPAAGGSSVGVKKITNQNDLDIAIAELIETDAVIVQEYITGTEVSCGVLDVKQGEKYVTTALPVTEIIPSAEFFDFKAKYTKGMSREITPANISPEMTRIIQDGALLAHNVLGCKNYSRTDFIIMDNRAYVLETNTLPGMTGTSLIPQQAAAAGYQMKDVFDWLIEQALIC